ncbi:HNH endonuclease [Cyanobium sp. LEGE 06143]|nr:HNH endonuclease [Cyanobium sp. LEGE 06143]
MQARDWAAGNAGGSNAVFLEELCPKLRARRWRQSLHQHTNRRCIYCGCRSESIDHVLPKSRGGPSVNENCVPACLGCNGRKGDSEVFSWYRQQPFYDPRRAMAIRAWTQGEMALATRLLAWTSSPASAPAAAASLAPEGPKAGERPGDHDLVALPQGSDGAQAEAPHQTRQAAGPLWRWQMAA